MGVPLVWSALSGKPSSPWLWSRPIDLLVIAGAGSMVFIVLAIPASYLWAGFGAAMITVFFHLSVVCNGPHYAATYQIVIRERHRRRRNWMWLAVTAPAVLAALMAIGFWPTVLLAPFTRLYLTLSPHHYAAQHFGMAALYSARRGRPLDPGEKRLLRFSFLGIGGFMMLMANTLVAESNEGLVGVPASRYVAQGGLPPFTYYIGLGLVAVSLGLVWLADRRLRRRTRRGMDGIVWLLFFVNFLWFVVPNLRLSGDAQPWVPPVLGAALIAAIPFFHCAQYLAVVGHRARGTGPVRPIVMLAALVVGGFAIFFGMARLTSQMTPIDIARATLLVDAVFNLHHFLLDAVIWRQLKAPSVSPVPAPAA
jgi:hypothetical protein